MLPARGHLDAAEADHVSLLLLDHQGLCGIGLPVRELALELFLGCPERVAYLLARLLESVAREAEDGWTVFRTEATQAAGHEGRLGR